MDKITLIKCMEYSGKAYADLKANAGINGTVFIDSKGGVQAFIRKSKGFALVAFRGSDSEKDWDTNLTFCHKKYPMKTHLPKYGSIRVLLTPTRKRESDLNCTSC